MQKLNLIIRGHIRNSFDNHNLYSLIRNARRISNIKIYIHTWNIVQNGLSWRHIEPVYREVKEDLILNYFGKNDPFFDMTDAIDEIIIDDDRKIVLHGKIGGTIGRTNCPVKGYKNMFYGMMRVAEHVYNNVGKDEKVIQTRFDILSNSFGFKFEDALEFFKRDVPCGRRVEFWGEKYFNGIDNMCVASAENMYLFIKHLYYNLDELNLKYKDEWQQERIAFGERDKF
jgi:hypothetical protein